MNEDEIKVVASNDLLNVASVLNKFLKNNEIVFTFPNLSQNSNRVTLWSALFEHLQRKTSVSVHVLCLASIRLLRFMTEYYECENILYLLHNTEHNNDHRLMVIKSIIKICDSDSIQKT